LKVVIDPLDGTSSFIAKDYKVSTILIGLLYKDKPVFGFIGSPFYSMDSDNIYLFFNLTNLGVYRIEIDTKGNIIQTKRFNKTSYKEKIKNSEKYIISRSNYSSISKKCI